MVGETGRTRTAVTPGTAGQLDARGEIGRAVRRAPIPAGRVVRIVEVDGLRRVVEPRDDVNAVLAEGSRAA